MLTSIRRFQPDKRVLGRTLRRPALGAWMAVYTWSAIALPAHADAMRRPGLNWVRLEGAEGCIAAQELAERVEARAGRTLFTTTTDAELFVTGRIEPRAGGGYSAVLQVTEASGAVLGERDLHTEGADCRALDEAIIVVIAITLYPDSDLAGVGIALDPEIERRLDAVLGAEPSELDPADLPTPEHGAPVETARATKSPPRAAAAAVPVGRRWRFGLEAAGALAYGRVPGVGVGIGIDARASSPAKIDIELGVEYFPGTWIDADGGDSSIHFASWLATLQVCAPPIAPVGSAVLCLGAEVGQLLTRPEGFSQAQRPQQDVLANLRLQALWRPPISRRVHLRLGAGVALPLVRWAYRYVDGTGDSVLAYETADFSVQAIAGLGVIF